jgi:hypothetical protein
MLSVNAAFIAHGWRRLPQKNSSGAWSERCLQFTDDPADLSG